MVPIMPRRLWCTLLIALGTTACEKKTPPTPSPGGTEGETITGRERIGWDQQAAGASELATFRYAIYVDNARSEVADATCATTAGAVGFACSGRLPAMVQGSHTLELAAFVLDGDVFESPRSTPLRVNVQAATASETSAVAWSSGPAGITSDGVPLAVERVADGLADPTDLAVAPDGRVFVAERRGSVRTIDDPGGQPSRTPSASVDVEGGELLALALDPQFARTHFVYVVYAAPADRSGDRPTYRLARFRETAGVLGERAVLVNEVAPVDGAGAASVRTMPDGRLLLSVGTNGHGGATSLEGKLLRLERDGTTPREQNGTPVITAVFDAPQGIAWDRGRSAAWIVDRAGAAATLSAVPIGPSVPPRAGVSYRLADADVRSAAVYEGDLLPAFRNDVLVASDEGRHLVRLRVPVAARSRTLTAERLLQDRVGGIRLVAVSPDGAIYFSTADTVGRITPR
ncbi:MAG: hypothetical protein A3H96_05100 [Acidobacteria bacterium RIFCSPLOWO2_02_FULL_67_36]|nr:MAG: hypothetical protein A3H96_05100 [Acidobacteria bacterium RIFCSPLOWO2_02_FULL_67_36]OFW21624.1 MAG: hypothetical protein A3G21_14580 [Acidobacteria bacterium RIFCSPLOWO2_12_FULL_66_21]